MYWCSCLVEWSDSGDAAAKGAEVECNRQVVLVASQVLEELR